MEFKNVIKKYFDTVYTESAYIEKTCKILNKAGFNADNTIVAVDVCRDEISQTLIALIRDKWGEAFNLCSLAAMFFAGKTALKAAMHHSPVVKGKERYVFYALPHIAIGAEGQLGICKRRGRKGESNACGALNVFLKELSNKKLNLSMDNEDVELSLIRMRLMREIPYGHIPDLLELTKITLKTIKEDLGNALSKIVDAKHSNYAFITGIQIHGPDGNYIWPDDSYAVISISGKRHIVKLPD
jgi:hypothetical protein